MKTQTSYLPLRQTSEIHRTRLSTVLFTHFILLILQACTEPGDTLFVKVRSGKSGILFNNTVSENDSINPLKQEFLYNGGGVGIGDFNKDGLPDIYFTASTVSNKLYLNKGNFSFQDITKQAQVTGEGRWFNGVSVVDINSDGWEDLYLSTTIKSDPNKRKNLLYINQGVDKAGIPAFKEMAREYGLADTSYSVQAAFFDYDKDGDLDMYLATTKPTTRNIYFFSNRKDTTKSDYDKLYQNNWDSAAQHPLFKDVSLEAGINEMGYGLGVSVGDINKDGWPDVYVTNDFISSDHLYINNKNGTFTNRVKESLKHTSQNAMGNDISDVNNDGWPDLISVDMNPEDNFRKQKNMAATNYTKYRNMFDYGYSLQFVRNTLQINQGLISPKEDSLRLPVFGDVSYYAGLAETDWSWTPSVADFDNDGLRDIFITNGYPKDVTDHDYIGYRKDKGIMATEQELLDQIPEIKVANYAFRNTPDLRFENVSEKWGLNELSYATGAAYADLDNDGDLDYIINNINSAASVYENTSDPKIKAGTNFIRIKFKGESTNKGGIGAKATLYYNEMPHIYENYPTRGYLSTVESYAHFGLGNLEFADSLSIEWPNGKIEQIAKIRSNQTIVADITNATEKHFLPKHKSAVLTDIGLESSINFVHSEYDYIDFDIQRLLPHKLSEFGPALASADVDGNGLDDLFVSGPKGKASHFFLQQSNGSFIRKPLQTFSSPYLKPWEELGALLLDVDNDKDPDLYLCSGSNEFKQQDTAYRDRLYLNDGKGNFAEQRAALPINLNSKQVVKAADFDHDGDLDLFIGSRSVPNEYPKPTSGYLYRNDSKNGHVRFTNVTASTASELSNLGLISDAIWSDFNNDGNIDLIVCGEFMAVTFFENRHGQLKKMETGLNKIKGLWNSITPADIDNDGLIDYVVGNLGLNSFYKASEQAPFEIYGHDFDNNGIFDAMPFLFLKDDKGAVAQYPAFTRDDMTEQLVRIKKQFLTYKTFAGASLHDILTKEEQKKAIKVSCNYMQSTVFRNEGNGSFKLMPLPYQAQWSPVYGILADDFDGDGNIDLLVNTNDLGTEVSTGQYDALNGLLLKGDGRGNFTVQPLEESGFFIPSNGKAIIKFLYRDQYALASSQNKSTLKVFKVNRKSKAIRLKRDEFTGNVFLKNGAVRREEAYYGNSFLSQSSRFIIVNDSVKKVEIFGNKGKRRELDF